MRAKKCMYIDERGEAGGFACLFGNKPAKEQEEGAGENLSTLKSRHR
jgi:hypothetical protein